MVRSNVNFFHPVVKQLTVGGIFNNSLRQLASVCWVSGIFFSLISLFYCHHVLQLVELLLQITAVICIYVGIRKNSAHMVAFALGFHCLCFLLITIYLSLQFLSKIQLTTPLSTHSTSSIYSLFSLPLVFTVWIQSLFPFFRLTYLQFIISLSIFHLFTIVILANYGMVLNLGAEAKIPFSLEVMSMALEVGESHIVPVQFFNNDDYIFLEQVSVSYYKRHKGYMECRSPSSPSIPRSENAFQDHSIEPPNLLYYMGQVTHRFDNIELSNHSITSPTSPSHSIHDVAVIYTPPVRETPLRKDWPRPEEESPVESNPFFSTGLQKEEPLSKRTHPSYESTESDIQMPFYQEDDFAPSLSALWNGLLVVLPPLKSPWSSLREFDMLLGIGVGLVASVFLEIRHSISPFVVLQNITVCGMVAAAFSERSKEITKGTIDFVLYGSLLVLMTTILQLTPCVLRAFSNAMTERKSPWDEEESLSCTLISFLRIFRLCCSIISVRVARKVRLAFKGDKAEDITQQQ